MLFRSAVDTLVCYSRERGCAGLLLEMIPVYITSDFREESVFALAEEGIESVYCQDSVVLYTDVEARLTNLFSADGVQYAAKQIIP